MTVILIYEARNGRIGVAKNYQAAIRHLINDHWINDYTEVWDDRAQEWRTLEEVLGEEWMDDMTFKWGIDDFNDFWSDSFSLVPMEVIE